MSVISWRWQSVFFLVGGIVWGSRQYAYTIPNVFIVMNLLGYA